MKNRLFLISALMLATSFGRLAHAESKTITVHVNGMVCAFCSQGLTKNFQAQEAVESVHIDMDKKEVRVSVKEGKDLSDELVTKLVKDAGVAVARIVR